MLSKDLKRGHNATALPAWIDDFVLEVPGGIIDEGESPRETVEREMKEELGLEGATIHETDIVYANPSMMTNKDHCFIAIGGVYKQQHLEAGDTFALVKMPLDELLAKINNQANIFQSLHLNAIFLALNFLKREGKLDTM